MNKNIIAVIAIAVVAILALTVFSIGDAGYTENDMGNDPESPASIWGTKVWVNFEDGSRETYENLKNNPLANMRVVVGGQDVESISYEISAKASGGGYSEAEIDFNDACAMLMRKEEDGSHIATIDSTGFIDDITTIPVDDQWHVVYTKTYTANWLQTNLPLGEHYLFFGDWDFENNYINYRGLPGGSWFSADYPSDRTIQVGIYEDEGFSLSFD